ncbi:MAG: hypothetical protein GX316_01880, partial [Firmicutes bacterium]|nr:hypothetical protein [Bacillota bacterium]
PFEGWSYEKIMDELGEINYYVNEKLNLPLVVPDDDISGTFTFHIEAGGVNLGDSKKELLVSNKQPSTIQITSDKDVIKGDGKSTAVITAYVWDLLGHPVDEDDCFVTFTTGEGLFVESGSRQAEVLVIDGKASLTLQSPLITATQPVRIPVRVSAENKDAGTVSAEIDIVFSPGALTGRLLNFQTGLPEAGIEVKLMLNGKPFDTGFTDENGYYIFDIGELGNYSIVVVYYDEDGDPYNVGCGCDVRAVGDDALNFGPRILQGRIADRMENGYGHIKVQLYDEMGGFLAETTTDAKGNYNFQIDAASAGLSSMSKGLGFAGTGHWQVVGIIGPDHTTRRSVAPLKPGDVLLNFKLYVESGGLVTDKLTGKPIPKAEVGLIYSGGPSKGKLVALPIHNGNAQPNPAAADSDGIYRMFAVPGMYQIAAAAAGYHNLTTASFSAGGAVMEAILLMPMGDQDLEIEKIAQNKFVDVGGESAFTVKLHNATPYSITQIEIQDTLPLGMDYVENSGTPAPVHKDGNLSWVLKDVEPGTHHLTYSTVVNENANVGDLLVNSVSAKMHGYETVFEAETGFTVAAWPKMDIDIKADRTHAEISDRVRYKIKLYNNPEGQTPMVSKETWLEVILPQGFEYQAGTSKLGGRTFLDPIIDGRVLRWDIGRAVPGQKLELDFAVGVTAKANLTDNITEAYVDGVSEAGYPYRFGPSKARLTLKKRIFGTSAAVVGTVFLDYNENGRQDPEEPGVKGVEILFDHGYKVTTDARGLYSMGGLEPGTRSITIDTTTLPFGYGVLGASGKQHASRFITLHPKGLAVEHIALIPLDGASGTGKAEQVNLKVAAGLVELTLHTQPFKITGFASGYIETDITDESKLAVRLDTRIDPKGNTEDELFPEWSRGDASIVKDMAPSAHPLYVSFIHPKGTVLYGDYDTTWQSAPRYTNYRRRETGLKFTHKPGITGYVFGEGRTLHTDDIAARGTAGLYYLDNILVSKGSEQVWLKAMAPDGNGGLTEMGRKAMTRGKDYEINYELGSILFNSPIPTYNEDFYENWIEVVYATPGQTEVEYGYGLEWRVGESPTAALTLVGGLAGGFGQDYLLGLDGLVANERFTLTYSGAANLMGGTALYVDNKLKAADALTVGLGAEHVQGDISPAGQENLLPEGSKVSLSLNIDLDDTYSLDLKTKYEALKGKDAKYQDEVGVKYHPTGDFQAEAGLKSAGPNLGPLSQDRTLSIFGRTMWDPMDRLSLTAFGEVPWPLALNEWQLELGSTYDMNEQAQARLGFKSSLGSLQRRNIWVLGLDVRPEGWPNLYGEYRLADDDTSQELALGLRQAFRLDSGLAVRIHAESVTGKDSTKDKLQGYAVSLGLGYDENLAFRPTLELEYGIRDKAEHGRVGIGAFGHIEPGITYEVMANRYLGDAASNRDSIKEELKAAFAYRDQTKTDHTVLAQYLQRSYVLEGSTDFSAQDKTIHAAALDWGYQITKELAVVAQGALKLTSESAADEKPYSAGVYLGQVGAEYKFKEYYTLGGYGRLLGDSYGAKHSGFAVELAREITEDLTLAVGYSTIALTDPDLADLVDWPRDFYLRLRLKF